MKYRVFASLAVVAAPPFALADVAMPAIFGDHMVLQRETDVALWGWARPGEAVSVAAPWLGADTTPTAVADARGRWRLTLPTPAAGGPYEVTITGANQLVFRDVLIGEVWLAGGQSNMEWPLRASDNAEQAIAQADQPTIRLFNVPNALSLHESGNAPGSWQVCSPASAQGFSAIGYHFARELSRELGVPIAIIESDWGGTPAQAWTPESALRQLGGYSRRLDQFAVMRDPERRMQLTGESLQTWFASFDGVGSPAVGPQWASPDYDDSAWAQTAVPATWAGDLKSFDGVVYFRVAFELSADVAARPATLELGPIDDRDESFVNGTLVGAARDENQWNTPRRYSVPGGLLRAGKNVLAVKALDTGGDGGINGSPDQLRLVPEGLPPIALAGNWRVRPGPAMDHLPAAPGGSDVDAHDPGVLFNAMISPIAPYGVRGTIWYQGEANRSEADRYGELFKAMIGAWRERFDRPAMPFYFVQIAPYGYRNDRGETALLREAQAAALALQNTGMVVTLDVGNAADIHPRDKETVGKRLAALALRDTYGRPEVVASGPGFSGAEPADGAMLVRLEAGGAGQQLLLRPTPDPAFWVAGTDRRFAPATAMLGSAGALVVRSDRVPQPVAVRYAWSAAPQAALFNSAGLPASPFRSDDWPLGKWEWDQDALMAALRSNEPGFVDLFGGRDLSGWANVNCAPGTFTVKNDGAAPPVIYCTGAPTGVLRTRATYENFVLELEFRHLVAGGNAGLFLHSDALTARGQPFTRAVEVQVMDGKETDWYTSDGDIFPIHGATMVPENGRKGDRAYPTERRMFPSPRWNHYRVESNNGDISLAVNGKVVTRGHRASPRKGFICLESEGSPVEFRNIRLRPLPSTNPGASEVATDAPGFVPLYTGVDLSGWKMTPVLEGHWKSEDWVLAFDGDAPDLWSEKSYKDFVLICDWRWSGKPKPIERPVILPDGSEANGPDGKPLLQSIPDAGDSGIYLRGSSKSQVNMWCWPIGSGEVYGYRTDDTMPTQVRAGVTPKAVADAPIGEWNRFEITMKGDRLTVVLNGKAVIENAHLPGIAPEGPIALQSHGSPVEFANIFIKELR